jgi:hypothetical protein
MRLRGRAAAATRWQLGRLGRAVRAGDALGAVTAAARIHSGAIRPLLRPGDWAHAHAACGWVLARLPAAGSQGPGCLRRLRRLREFFLADAALAARESGELGAAARHLGELIGCLRERGAPAAELAAAHLDLARVHLAAGDAAAARRTLADMGPLLLASADHGVISGLTAAPDACGASASC